ncbi:hypothetical protein MES5069_220167 [Mesorhizobium escarrei]|uniref:Uncharacterized protein n=1 Tax=Mesorhizobium escarrei TaxID=666018 RepID=A0ABM9DRZ4_9HYPH|nr:hypothetical protein MES5069_220167 [Mesorhizobium escarrei]
MRAIQNIPTPPPPKAHRPGSELSLLPGPSKCLRPVSQRREVSLSLRYVGNVPFLRALRWCLSASTCLSRPALTASYHKSPPKCSRLSFATRTAVKRY